MAIQVWDKARRQGADLLEACAIGLHEHFQAIGKSYPITSRGWIEKKWSLAYGVCPKKNNKLSKPKLQAGIDIVTGKSPELIPWFWREGSNAAETVLETILGPKIKVRASELGWEPGYVGLERIAIPMADSEGFDVDSSTLASSVGKAFQAIGANELSTLWP